MMAEEMKLFATLIGEALHDGLSVTATVMFETMADKWNGQYVKELNQIY
jgi:hypothetical protein